MKHKQHRYVQPHNVREAMELIQKLFNQYRNAPLTRELLDYHNNLVHRLNDDIHDAAVKEGNPKQLEQLENMADVMRRWVSIRLSGSPFEAKMRHFKLYSDGGTKFKRKVHKIKGSGNYRASRH
ncbi:hypothetical protein FD27_GL000750 [Limosilactobacillus frumenti DSM 13145]|uniref:Uncharacterized protein n=1 Tax=Limosilactobacillus frumenti DSM 13145 TaxID=1423746 RepID=A0A0R1PE62_9LACO|nr:hypothetical protein [Limosilactobacillus frumenti]KRL27003.1 hypothetical protein FD27_GL000750 [Limosilactobacillus frumenti DSM 13145]MBA2914485.1 hypothetical protein [Limosilactobacillus frumenti]QFG72480.1 hypothetical protein LF145_03610 [Limosilactobacillus frumenti]